MKRVYYTVMFRERGSRLRDDWQVCKPQFRMARAQAEIQRRGMLMRDPAGACEYKVFKITEEPIERDLVEDQGQPAQRI